MVEESEEVSEELSMESEFKILRRRFEDHLIDHRIRNKEYEERQIQQDKLHQQNMQAIAELTAATKDVVDAWKVANGLQRFVKWASSFAIIGGVIAFLSKHFH